jgi:hypothetical protein
MVCLQCAWGPQAQRVAGSRGYAERHCYRVGQNPQYQFQRSLGWKPQPVALRAISEEVMAQDSEADFRSNGHQVRHLLLRFVSNININYMSSFVLEHVITLPVSGAPSERKHKLISGVLCPSAHLFDV